MSGARAFDTAKGMSCKTVLMQSQCAMCTVQPAYLCSSFFIIYIFVENPSFDFRWASAIRQSSLMPYTNQMRGIPNSQSHQLTKRPGLSKLYYLKSNKKWNFVRKMCVQMQCAGYQFEIIENIYLNKRNAAAAAAHNLMILFNDIQIDES